MAMNEQERRRELQRQFRLEKDIAEQYRQGPKMQGLGGTGAMTSPATTKSAGIKDEEKKRTYNTQQQNSVNQPPPQSPADRAAIDMPSKNKQESDTNDQKKDERQSARSLAQDKKNDKEQEKSKNPISALTNLAAGLATGSGSEISLVRKILFLFLMAFAVVFDLVNLLGVGSVVDWIIDFIFWIMAFFVAFELDFDSIFIRRLTINTIGTIAEFIPLIDMLPFHVLVVITIYVDMKYDIFKTIKNLKGGGNPISSKTSK